MYISHPKYVSTIKVSAHKAKRYAAAGESLAEAAQKLEALVHDVNNLDDRSLQELQNEMPDYAKIKKYIEDNLQEGYPVSLQEIEGEEGLPLLFKALILTKVREMQAKVESRLMESTSDEEIAELTSAAEQLDKLEGVITHNLGNIKRVENTDTRRTILQKFLEEKGKMTQEELTPQEMDEFRRKYLPAARSKGVDTGFTDKSNSNVELIQQRFEDALGLIENAYNEISSYEDFFTEIEMEASQTGSVAAYRQITIPAGRSIEEFLNAKGDNIGRVWHKTEESAPPEDDEFQAGGGDSYIIEANIPKGSIDWETMRKVYHAEGGPNAQAVIGEIFVTQGAPISLSKIFKVSEEGDEMEIPMGRDTVRANDVADIIRIAEAKFAEFTSHRKKAPLTEDRKSPPETPAGAAPETHASVQTVPGLVAKPVRSSSTKYKW